jgi:hypothetical protein
MEFLITDIQNFLLFNGFVEQENKELRENKIICFTNKKCIVYLSEEKEGFYIRIHTKTLRSLNKGSDLYWLIGVLTFHKFIKRDYILPKECKKEKTKVKLL